MYTLRPYQETAVQEAVESPFRYEAFDMGLGKTLMMLDFLKRTGQKALVMAPLLVATRTWPQEIRKWTDMTYTVLHGTDKGDLYRQKSDIKIINFDGAKWFYDQIVKYGSIDLKDRVLIIDEATALKSHKSVRFKKVSPLRHFFKNNGIFCLSGEPMPNGYLDLWSQYFMIDGGDALYRTYQDYEDEFFIRNRYNKYDIRLRNGAMEIIQKRVAPITSILRASDHLTMPESVFIETKVELPPAARDMYNKFRDDYIVEFGKDLEYIEYEQLMPFVKHDKKAFFVVLGDYVTTEDGTGIVHTAPAFGEDDYNVGRKYGLPVVQPVGEDGKYIGTIWDGRFVMEEGLDVDIIKWLAAENKLYSKEKMDHNYPHCWRCQTPLLYYAKPSYYIEMTKLKDQLVSNNNTVNWFPDYVGEKRFGNWLENVNDWAISRSRYWGTPLNIWTCSCGHKESIGSISELVEKSIEPIDESIELHRPYVDDIHINCPKCNEQMTRVKDVIDCWFDSGSMPFAQHHYPFENKENFDELFPADFICEGIDQTRGWFYSLIAISTFVMGKSPYKNVLVNDLILDKDGKKMSKSRGNTVDPFEMFDKYGADVLRWYLLYVSPAWTPTKFDVDALKEVQSKFFGTIKNVYNFFSLYANTDNIDPKEFFIPYNERPELDRWILSKYNNLKKYVEVELERYDMTKTVRAIQDFVNEDLSNWYIRRSRRRFWDTELTLDKKSVYNTTFEVLVGIAQMVAPFSPFLSEELYRKLTGELSVHISHYPRCNAELIDEKLEHKMDLVKNLVTLGRASREAAKIKVRQPIGKAYIDASYEAIMKDLLPLIEEELNVKEVIFSKDINQYMNFSLKPNFATLGKTLGPKLKEFSSKLSALDAPEAVNKLQNGDSIAFDLAGESFTFTKDDVLINVSPKEGFDVATENNLFIVLDTNLTPELINEGFAREFISKIQQMRKAQDLEMMDKIKVYFTSTEEVAKAIEIHTDYIKDETLALEIVNGETSNMQEDIINGHDAKIAVEKQ